MDNSDGVKFSACFAGGIFSGCEQWSESTKRACFDAYFMYQNRVVGQPIVWKVDSSSVAVGDECRGVVGLSRIGGEQCGFTSGVSDVDSRFVCTAGGRGQDGNDCNRLSGLGSSSNLDDKFSVSGVCVSSAGESQVACAQFGSKFVVTESGDVDDKGMIEERSADVVSEKTLANRQKRAKKKERKLRKQSLGVDQHVPEWRRGARPSSYRGAFIDCSVEVRRELAETRAQRLIAENRASVREAQARADGWAVVQKARRKRETLKAMQVDQKIELMRSVDVDQLKKRQQTRIMRDTEVNKVDVEKAHNSLVMTGNVPGSVETIISSGSISPSSSISAAEVRKLHKKVLDLEKHNADLVERLRGCKVGVDDDVPYSVGITVDEEGNPVGDFGDGYGGYIGTDGRFHTGINWAEYY